MKYSKALLQFAALIALALVAASHAYGDVSSELEALGSSGQVRERASRLESRTRVSIVQGRAVDRNWRLELGTSYGGAAFGDSYLNTQNLGANVDLHITPKVSIGVRYAKAFNQLTAEGKNRLEQARAANANTGDDTIPQISYPDEQVMGVLDWYMTYGKINLFDWKTVQFDIYSLAGYGQIKIDTRSGGQELSEWTGTWTAGGGIGFWLSQHFTTRFELRYQNYSDRQYAGSRDLNVVVGTFGLGVLL